MSLAERLLEVERGFWVSPDRRPFYEANLASGAVMVFPAPFGIVGRAGAINAAEQAPVWEDVELEENDLVGVTDTSATLVYKATGRRPDGSLYRTYASSVYIRDRDAWKLALHQQTPIPND
jgi:hypothetical protein